jgi:endonuclease YncB( thermonuclease family)
MDGDSFKAHRDKGFGDWNICTIYPGAEKEARYPQGVYRLFGINTPEVRGVERPQGLLALARLNELLSQSATGDSVLIATHKDKEHGKYRYMVEILIPTNPPPLEFEVDDEKKHWVERDDLVELLAQTEKAEPGASTVRSLVTEVLARRRAMGEGRFINANQTLLEEGLAKPYFGGKKK